MPFEPALLKQVEALLAQCRAGGLKIATAESCTGGLVSGCLTEIAGSSDVFERGFVTYSNDAKTQLLGVPAAVIAQHGAVSEIVARLMAEGAVFRSEADIAVAITGIAGPGGGSAEKPVGLVHFAAHRRGGQTILRAERLGDIGRTPIRTASLQIALDLLAQAAQAK